jgi:hypothetical protein
VGDLGVVALVLFVTDLSVQIVCVSGVPFKPPEKETLKNLKESGR